MLSRLCLTALLSATLGGCSLAFTSGPPPEDQRGAAFSCTTSYAAPVLDLAWTGYALGAAAAEKNGGIGGVDIALSALWVGSAAYGIWNVTRCEQAIREANLYRGVSGPRADPSEPPRGPVDPFPVIGPLPFVGRR